MEEQPQPYSSETENTRLTSIQDLLKDKRIIVGIVVMAILGVIYFILMWFQSSKKAVLPNGIEQSSSGNTVPANGLVPTIVTKQSSLTLEDQKTIRAAVADQQKADKEYGEWQAAMRREYPWRVYLPLHTDSYFVLFDVKRKIFIGMLYPVNGETEVNLKSRIMADLRSKGVPVDNFNVLWNATSSAAIDAE